MWTSPIFPPSRVRKAPYGVMRLTVPSMTAPTSRSARTPPRSELRRPPCRSTPAHRRIASLPSARLGRQRLGGRGRARAGRWAGRWVRARPPARAPAHWGRKRSGSGPDGTVAVYAVGCGRGGWKEGWSLARPRTRVVSPALPLAGGFAVDGGDGGDGVVGVLVFGLAVGLGGGGAVVLRLVGCRGGWGSARGSGGWLRVVDRLFEGEEAVLRVMGRQIASEKRRNPWTSRDRSPPRARDAATRGHTGDGCRFT
jgi:hypothetical protein